MLSKILVRPRISTIIAVIRWSSRILSLAYIIPLGTLLLLGVLSHNQFPADATRSEKIIWYLQYALILGLLLCWKWELKAAFATICVYFVFLALSTGHSSPQDWSWSRNWLQIVFEGSLVLFVATGVLETSCGNASGNC
jgi:hypothetical protein